jgi:hypothetical protein
LKKYRIDTLEEMRRVLFFLIWEEAQEIDLFTPADKQYVDVFRRLFIYLTHHNIQIRFGEDGEQYPEKDFRPTMRIVADYWEKHRDMMFDGHYVFNLIRLISHERAVCGGSMRLTKSARTTNDAYPTTSDID